MQTKGSLAWWGYRLPIQLPLIWETLQLALASTLVAVAIATIFAFLAANNAWTPAPVRFAIRVLVAFLRTMPELAWAVIFVMAVRHRRDPGISGADAAHRRQPDQTVLRGGGERAKQTGTRPGGLRRVAAAENPLRPVAASETAVSPTALCGLKSTSVRRRFSGLVGAGGIGQELMTNIKLDRYDQVSITLLLIILVVSALDMLSGRLRLWVLEGKK